SGRVVCQKAPRTSAVKRRQVDSLLFGSAQNEKHEVVSIGQKLGKTVSRLSGSQLGYLRTLSAGTRRAEDSAHPDRCIKDGAVAVPRAAKSGWCASQRLRRPAADIHSLQLAFGEKTDRPVIGRPEGILCGVGPRQRSCIDRLETPHPKAGWSVSRSDKDQ